MTFVQSDKHRPSVYGPAGYTLIRFCANMFRELNRRLKMQSSLGKLSARDLRDIGLTKDDVASAGHYPLSQNTSETLRQKTLQRATNW